MAVVCRDISYNGLYYAFGASGGFIVQQGFNPIVLTPTTAILQYDFTDSIQLCFSARTINKRMGILKDTSNINVVEAMYDMSNDTLNNDSVKISTCEFINGINTNCVISVGKLQSLYSDFKYTVGRYFGDPGGTFATMFSNANTFDINNGIFDASALIQVVNSSTFSMTGSFVSDLSGFITINNINKTLKSAINSNVFNNRAPTADKSVFGIVDGFIAGDFVFVPAGFTISLSLDIQSESFLPTANYGTASLDMINSQLNYVNGYVKRTTTYTTTNITQTTTLPIVLSLKDETLQNYMNYGQTWTVSTNVVIDGIVTNTNKNWVAISISTTGKYQTAITDTGDIYVSADYGTTRTLVYNIGVSPSNSIAISFSGQYQTASNGHNIYVSNNYGSTWTMTYSGGTSNIYVSISLNGKYQTMVSCGDTVYMSKDYGVSWNQLDVDIDTNNVITELYQSIEIFPTAGVALSYNGKYQTIVSENIYTSSDFGKTWINISETNPFGDKNWQDVAMSSDGKYQTAVDSGGDVYTSVDFGVTWNIINLDILMDKLWVSISSSATGQYQTILQTNGDIYVTNDYGVTWTDVQDSLVLGKNWTSVSVSSDALYQCAVEYGGQIYMSNLMIQYGSICTC